MPIEAASSSQNQDGRSRRRTEPRGKLKKLRSIKLSRSSSSKACGGGRISGLNAADSYGNAGTFQKHVRTLARQSSSRAVRAMKRMPSLKSRRPDLKKFSAASEQNGKSTRTEPKKKFKKARSIKLAYTADVGLESRPHCRGQPEGSSSNDQKAVRTLTRKSSLKPLRFLAKLGSFRSRKPSGKKCSTVAEFSDMGIDRATCSSTLKDSKFPDLAKVHPRGDKMEEISVSEVCPYTYCCLSGHHHSRLPPLNRSLSKKRQTVKTQKSLKLKGPLPIEAKYSCDNEKDTGAETCCRGSVDVNASEASGKELKDKTNVTVSKCCEESVRTEELLLPQGGGRVIISGEPLENLPADSVQKMANSPASQKLHPHPESKFSSPTPVGDNVMFERRNFNGTWHLLYRRVVSRIAVEVKIRPVLDGANEEQAHEDGTSLNSCVPDETIGLESHGKGFQTGDMSQMDAVQLVQDAVDAMFPPENEDQSSDELSVTTDKAPGQGLSEFIDEETKDPCISGKCIPRGSGESNKPEAENTPLGTENIWARADKTRSQHPQPSSWSNIKKLFLLKRFIKELQKVRRFTPRSPLLMPLDPGTEADKVYLRHQNMDERRSAEEWLLDYALRQVVAKLTPARKKKVELLIEALESVGPLPEVQNDPRNIAATSAQRNNEVDGLPHGEPAGISCKVETSQNTFQETAVSSSSVSSIVKEACNPINSECHVAVMKHRTELPEGCKENYLNPISGLSKDHTKPAAAVWKSDASICENLNVVESREGNGMISLADSCNSSKEQVDRPKDDMKCLEPDNEPKACDGLLSESESVSTTSNAENRILWNKQRSFRMWHVLYQNAVSCIAKEVENQLPFDQADDQKQVGCKLHNIVRSSSSEGGEDVRVENSDAGGCKDDELNQGEIIKMVKEAVDAVIPPETQGQSPLTVKSIRGNTTSDHTSSKQNHQNGAEQSNMIMDDEEARLERENSTASEEEATKPKLGDNIDAKLPKKSWSKLRRIILLKRFIKQMDKVRKFMPQQPRYLPLEPISEAEKVILKHQMGDQRRNAEEWMLDFALQQVIAQLTPARKRRVALLVEAFETFNPLP